MKKKHYSRSKNSKGTSPSSRIIIIVLFIILAILIYNYFISIHDTSSSPDKKITDYFKPSSKKNNVDSSSTEPNPINENSFQNKTNTSLSPTIIIDAGHGGPDPGKVSESGTLEKDINLTIALHLKKLLETQNISVIMIREEDKDLATETNKRKLSDIKERVNIMENSNADMVISIHQNSYPDPNVYGAQCFYPSNSEEGKKLATIIQNQIITSTNQTKIREIKSNDDYYLLKHSPIPIVIVECGFLTNPEEETLLLTEEYQRKMAWSIHLGILQYFNIK